MKRVYYIDANGHQVEKIMKPYGAEERKGKRFKKGKKVDRNTIRGQ
jgi:hypothetical protein